MLRYVDTRWLSLESSVSRILERNAELIKYFEETESDTEFMVKTMKKPETIIYLQFLNVFLTKINKLKFGISEKFFNDSINYTKTQ